MRKARTRRSLLAALVASGGCLGISNRSSESATPEPVEVREWPGEYYRGPLVSAHEHMAGPDGFWMTEEQLDWFVRWMRRNRVADAMAITHPSLISEVRDHENRLVPFCSATVGLRDNFSDLSTFLEQRLNKYPIYRGLGEFGLYRHPGPNGKPPIPADHPNMLEVYDLAANRDIPVMVHGGQQGQYGNGRDPVVDMETAFEHNRDCTFLVHGTFQAGVTIDDESEVPVGEAVATLLERHPNFYYDISGQSSPFAYNWRRPPDDDHQNVNPEEIRSQEWFDAKLAESGGLDQHAERLYEKFKPILKNHSDRVTWGMDASWQWHYNAWALNAWADIARSLLGRLSDEQAKNVGYMTASELFGISVDTD